MSNYKEHIFFKFFTILLVTVLLFPSIVKFNHIFENHKHEVCKSNSVEHFHELEIDCEFYKFNTTNQYLVQFNSELPLIFFHKSIIEYSNYTFLNSHQQFNISLRGPPITLV